MLEAALNVNNPYCDKSGIKKTTPIARGRFKCFHNGIILIVICFIDGRFMFSLASMNYAALRFRFLKTIFDIHYTVGF